MRCEAGDADEEEDDDNCFFVGVTYVEDEAADRAAGGEDSVAADVVISVAKGSFDSSAISRLSETKAQQASSSRESACRKEDGYAYVGEGGCVCACACEASVLCSREGVGSDEDEDDGKGEEDEADRR